MFTICLFKVDGARYNLAFFYEHGIGVSQNYDFAEEYTDRRLLFGGKQWSQAIDSGFGTFSVILSYMKEV